MAEIKDIIVHFLEASKKHSESKTRLTKMIYLCDWKYALEYDQQMTRIHWVFDNFGPFVWDVMKTVEKYEHVFQVRSQKTPFGIDKTLISLSPHIYEPAKLNPEEQQVLNFVMQSTENLNWNEFIKLVYSTYPVITSNRYENLNLVHLAHEYKTTPFYKKVSPDIEFIPIKKEEDEF